MTHADMLQHLGMTDSEFRDLLAKFAAFSSALSSNQRRLVTTSLPSMAEAAASFGTDLSEEDLAAFLADFTPSDAVFTNNMRCCVKETDDGS
jgi:hypothetical protein